MSVRAAPRGFPERRFRDIPAVSGAEMLEIQKAAQEDFGLDLSTLIENGGRAVATMVLAMLGGRGRGQRLVVLAGGGNNGATGLCAARHLVNWGFAVEPVFGVVESEMSPAARQQLKVLEASGILEPHDLETSQITVEAHLSRAELAIDALAGYGLQGRASGITAAVIELAHACKRPILAVDIPTGVSATTGEASEPAIRAATTLMLDLPKQGLLTEVARDAVGELFLADLGIPRRVYERFGILAEELFVEGPLVRIRR
jgi:NAD(P)H-hydrate epimerase